MRFRPPGSNRVTDGVRVEVAARFLSRESRPDEEHYFFAYDVRISNGGSFDARVVSRHWIVINANGDRQEVRGPGVVGEKPLLAPGQSFEYTSFCPLDTPWGTMEGSLRLERPDGSRFDVEVGRFYLVADVPAPAAHAQA